MISNQEKQTSFLVIKKKKQKKNAELLGDSFLAQVQLHCLKKKILKKKSSLKKERNKHLKHAQMTTIPCAT